jgi:hypothetical protein
MLSKVANRHKWLEGQVEFKQGTQARHVVHSPLGASGDGLQASSPPCDEPLPSPLPLLAFRPSLDPLPGAEHSWTSIMKRYCVGRSECYSACALHYNTSDAQCTTRKQ